MRNIKGFKIIFAVILFFCSHSFAESGPDLYLEKEKKIIPFDSSYVQLASADVTRKMFDFVTKRIDQTISQGITVIGNVDLQNVKQQIKSIRLYLVAMGVSAIGAGRFSIRQDFAYFPFTHSIYLNSGALQEDPERWLQLFLHECLGALEYNDENYQISSVIYSKNANVVTQKIKAQNADFSGKLIQNPHVDVKDFGRMKSGGGTVVGGGGDEVLFSAKTYMIDHFDYFRTTVLPFFLEKYKNHEVSLHFGFDLDLESKINDQLIDEYMIYFLKTPFESMTANEGVPDGPLSDMNDVEKIVGVFDNKLSTAFIRLSRKHWDWRIGSLSLDESRLLITNDVQLQLFAAFLVIKFGPPKAPAK
jgi:hypothetical protein